MKYWLQQGESLEAAMTWRKEGITTKTHMTIGPLKISVEEWREWRNVTSIAEAAVWIARGFTPTTAAQWVDHKVNPEAAALLQQKVTPSEAAEWLQSGIDVEVLLDWCSAIPCANEAAAFYEEKFKPKEAAAWFELKIQAPEAASFRNIGWVPERVTNWLHANKVTYGEIRKYFHPNIGPESATLWKHHGFAPGEAKLWADLIVDVKVAITLRSHKVLPMTIAKFIERKYSLDEAIMYALEGTPLEKARPPQNGDHPKASYSERVKRGKEPPLSGPIPFEDFIRDHMAQGNPYKSMPKSYVKNAIRIYLNNLSGGSLRGYLQAIFSTLDKEFKDIEVEHKWSPENGYVDIGFPNTTIRDTAARLEFIHNGTLLKVDITRYAHHQAKWVTFTNLPTDKSSEWVREAIITGAAYYGTVLECREEGNFKARCMRPNTLHVLLEAAPIIKSRNTALPRFVRLPGCSGSVIYVEPENARQVCHFCYALGHNIHQCNIKKGVHIRDYDMDIEKGVTRLGTKNMCALNLYGGSPPKVNEIFAMKAIQRSLEERHKADIAREEELTNSDKTGDFVDPLVPDEERMDDGSNLADRVVHPDLNEWHKTHEKPPKPLKKPQMQKNASQKDPKSQAQPKGFTINDPKLRKNGQRKGNPIPVPGKKAPQNM
ncbi:hypothetical protein DSO57_1022675 [Entomophthora muscae]|uniref:Uncharacterized protein n=1 Tax=Entomophthora muscae TaxID=34485 RepID=A0ACC2SSD4_9FUNG|nr:hypothetical protein DSO57_1022675 [Entomophthora muscae]